MKLLIFSDSHGNTAHMRQAVELERPDRILHLGDMVRDAAALERMFPELPVEKVSGNCDCRPDVPPKKLLELEDHPILMTHGHIYNVKVSIGTATLAAREAGAELLLFGHTHEPLCDFWEGLWVLNPGSIRGPFQPTYGVVELRDEKINCSLRELRAD